MGVDKDLSKDDPYHQTYCRYFKNGTPASPAPLVSYLPSSLPSDPMMCGTIGYERTRPMGMPPCRWIATAYNPNGGSGLCVGQPDVCEPLTKDQCDAIDRSSADGGGWSRYVLPMTKYGPVIATEFGSFDCSSPFVTEFMNYSDTYGVSYTAWALWPQNNGGTLNMGSCSYPAINEAFPNLEHALRHRLQSLPESFRLRKGDEPAHALGRPCRVRQHPQARQRTGIELARVLRCNMSCLLKPYHAVRSRRGARISRQPLGPVVGRVSACWRNVPSQEAHASSGRPLVAQGAQR